MKILALLLVLLCSPANAGMKAVSTPSAGSLIGQVPVSGGGTGTNIPTGSQANFSNTVTVSNALGTSSVITNATLYPLASPANLSGVIDTSHFAWTEGTPVSNIFGFVFSLTPYMPQNGGIFSIEFMAETSQLDLQTLPNSYGEIDIEVDGQLVFNEPLSTGYFIATGTAQAGGASTITLANTSSSTNGFYNQEYVYITGGTGAGQRARITGYVGATNVATVTPAWSTQPTNTSTYSITPSNVSYGAAVGSTQYYPTLTFGGEIRPHYIKITSIATSILRIGVDSSGTIWKPEMPFKPTVFIVGDSYPAGYGAAFPQDYASQFCKNLNVWCHIDGLWGTGYVNAGGFMTYAQRVTPPVNSWYIAPGGATGGSFTLTQSSTTTGAINQGSTPAQVQTALNTAFGANQWNVWYANSAGSLSQNLYDYVIENVGTATSSSAPLTINSSLTGTSVTPFVSQYTGDITPLLPKDNSGNVLPFYLVNQGSINDFSSYATLGTAASSLYTSEISRFPTATILATGIPMTYGPITGTNLTAQTNLQSAVASTLPLVNGNSPFIATYNASTGVGYINGSTTTATATGASGVNSDLMVYADQVHPSPFGHLFLSNVFTQEFVSLTKATK